MRFNFFFLTCHVLLDYKGVRLVYMIAERKKKKNYDLTLFRVVLKEKIVYTSK